MSVLKPVELDKPIPHDPEAERVLIGNILLDNSQYAEICAELSDGDIFLPGNRLVYQAIGRVIGQQSVADPLTVQSELRMSGDLDRVGGGAFVASLLDGVPRLSNVGEYIKLVKNASISRKLINAGASITSVGFDSSMPAAEQVEHAERLIAGIETAGREVSIRTASEIGWASLQDIEDFVASDRPILGLGTGFTDLDFHTGGLLKTDLVIIAARPSMGKTAISLRMAAGVAEYRHNDEPVQVYFSMEMSAKKLVERIQFGLARVDSSRIRNKQLTREDWRRMDEAQQRISKWNLIIDDESRTVSEMRRMVRRVQRQFGRVDIVWQDHIGLVNGKARSQESRNQEVGRISRELKDLAKEFDVPVVVLSQLSRANDARGDKRPTLSDLRDSGEIEQNADVVMFPHRQHYYDKEADPSAAELAIAKQRNGPTLTVKLRWLREFAWYENATTETVQQ